MGNPRLSSKWSRILIIVLLAISLIAPAIPIVKSDPGTLSGWEKRVQITIDHDDIDDALSNFPILIYISDSSGVNNEDLTFIFDEVGANSLKIAVTEDDGTTECYVEVEKWDLGNEKAWLWAKIPSIASDADTELYLYYDNDHADNNAHVGVTNSVVAENVWDINFEFVSHMRDNPDASNIRDSTENDIDGAKKGPNEPIILTTGQIDGSQDFDGANDYISLGVNSFNLLVNNDFTIECWASRDAMVGGIDHQFICLEGAANIQYDDGNSRIEFYIYDGGNNYVLGPDVIAGVWYYYVLTEDNTNMRGYINLNLEGTTPANRPSMGDFDRDNRLGSFHVGVLFFNGRMDEVRVSTTVRNSAWLKATYESGIDDLLDFGSEELAISAPTDPDLLFGAGFNASSPYVELHWNHSLVGVQFFEVQNSSDGESWTYLGQNTTTWYTDSTVSNGTERYYKVRACNQTGGTWYNSSFSDVNFETVYFVQAAGNGNGDTYVTGSVGIFLMAFIVLLPIIIYAVKKK